MAATTRGTALLKWGTYTLTTYVVKVCSIGKQGESYEVQDEDGQFLSEVEKYGLQDLVELQVIPLSTATEPAIGDTITYNTIKYSLKDLKKVNNIGQPEMWTLQLRRLIGITYT